MQFDGNTLAAAIERFNADEMRRRTDYHAYLASRGDDVESLEEHIEKYGMLARTPRPATPDEIAAIEAHVGHPLPEEMHAFYLRFGGLTVGQMGMHSLNLPAPSDLARRLKLEDGWQRFESLGLADMILASWGFERDELDPRTGLFSEQEIRRANEELHCVGWIRTGDGEAHRYLCFDRLGQIFTLDFHQDHADGLRSGLTRLLAGNMEPESLGDVLIGTIDEWRRAMAELDDEE